VQEAVNSVLGQSYGYVELIVVDDGSTDGSLNILEKLSEQNVGRMKVLTQNREGPYPARNHGLRHASGKFVAFLDADDYWDQQCLEKLHAGLTAGQADLAYCGWQNVGEGIEFNPHVPPEYEKDDPVAHFLRSCPWPIHAALVKRELVDHLRGFSDRRFSSMDYDFWLRALAATRKITRVPEVLAYYRWHGHGQVSAVKWRQVLDALAAQLNFIRANPELVAHLPQSRLDELTEGQVLRQAYRAIWKRDLVSAQKLFRHAAAARSFRVGDLRHILSALMPMPVYRWITKLAERRYG
jgi:GT2 family glycosyltransferase